MPTLTITITPEQAQHIAAAYGEKLGLFTDQQPVVPATEAQIKALLIDEIKSVVRGYERRVAHASVTIPPDVEPA